MIKILLVEDDPEIARLLKLLLTTEGFEVARVGSAEDGHRHLAEQSPDIVLLDVMLPDEDGISFCQSIRGQGYDGHILILTACADDITEMTSFNCGADDYLAKPVRPAILIARLKALLKRGRIGSSTLTLEGGFELNSSHRKLVFKGAEIELTDSEMDILILLATASGPVSREVCYQKLRGIPYDGLNRAVDMRISTLRNKLLSYARVQTSYEP